ncbi:MAG: stage II sporulation protein P, partial [Oscillospiraceae bacterium]|nr:stage II sporulation protein P [Oscillospiraceae bacterium]
MNEKRRSTFLGAAVLIFAMMLRLSGGLTTVYGHILRLPERVEASLNRWPQGGLSAATMPDIPPTTQPVISVTGPVFTKADLKTVPMRYDSGCKYRPDLESLLTEPLTWALDSGEPTVLIVHTHGCESYTKTAGETYTEHGNYRTRNANYNMVAVGQLLAQRLEAAGVSVIHDRQCHDDPSYDDAYRSARASVQEYLDRYPSIQLVLDLHRDAATYADGSQYATGVTVDGQRVAQLMLVMGTDSTGLHYPQWQDNLSVALK